MKEKGKFTIIYRDNQGRTHGETNLTQELCDIAERVLDSLAVDYDEYILLKSIDENGDEIYPENVIIDGGDDYV